MMSNSKENPESAAPVTDFSQCLTKISDFINSNSDIIPAIDYSVHHHLITVINSELKHCLSTISNVLDIDIKNDDQLISLLKVLLINFTISKS